MRNLLITLIVFISGCSTVIDERNFIRPDRLSGFKSNASFNVRALPLSAVVHQESIAIDKDIELRGLSVQQTAAAATVLYFGGNMFHIDAHAEAVLPVLAECGVNLAVFDYRGYGRSQGVPTVANMKSDALKIFDFVNEHTPGKVIVHGQSLGSFIAAYVAQQRPVLGMVLESTATNPEDWADANIPWYVAPFMKIQISPSLGEIDNSVAVSKFSGASLVMVGAQDKITPPRLGQKVFDSIPSASKQMLTIDGVGHNGVLEHPASKPAYCKFIKQLASAPSPK